MNYYIQHGCYWITHSRYFNQWVGGLPYAPHVYWNVITDDEDIIPVCTYGYKNLKSAKQKIKKYIVDVKECCLLHIETEEECYIRCQKQRLQIMRNWDNKTQTNSTKLSLGA